MDTKKSRTTDGAPSSITRATFVVDTELYRTFQACAKRQERTFSQEIRRLMRDYVNDAQRSGSAS